MRSFSSDSRYWLIGQPNIRIVFTVIFTHIIQCLEDFLQLIKKKYSNWGPLYMASVRNLFKGIVSRNLFKKKSISYFNLPKFTSRNQCALLNVIVIILKRVVVCFFWDIEAEIRGKRFRISK